MPRLTAQRVAGPLRGPWMWPRYGMLLTIDDYRGGDHRLPLGD
ncbi:hypothetical protein [Pseudomonas sp.]|nr:hypothetical protein [Pseudomonas sp.]